EEAIGLAGKRREAGLLEAEALEHLLLFVLRQLRELGLELAAHDDDAAAFLVGMLADARDEGAVSLGVGLVDVRDVEDLLRGDEPEAAQDLHLLRIRDAERADRLARLQRVVTL